MTYSQCRIGAIRTFEDIFAGFVPSHKAYYADPSQFQVEPFQIFGNLYYVGDQKVCMHLVDTCDGLILFDSGYPHALECLLTSIRKLGFDPADIRYVIHSHGHFDHFGCGDWLRDNYGCKIFMSRVDTELLREMPERGLCHLGPWGGSPICWPDEMVDDGQDICLGNTTIHCRLAPGHTFGTLAFFFDVTDGKETRRVGYWGGVGLLTVYKAHCRAYNLPENKCQLMKRTIEVLRRESVDIVIGNHPSQNCTLEKRQYWLTHPDRNPFDNPNAWCIILDAVEEKRQEFEALGY